MSQVTTLGPAASITNCPTWCSTDHGDGDPHFGQFFDLDLSLAEPGYVPIDGSEVSDYLSMILMQAADGSDPVISGTASAIDFVEMADLTLDEAEALGNALLNLVAAGRVGRRRVA